MLPRSTRRVPPAAILAPFVLTVVFVWAVRTGASSAAAGVPASATDAATSAKVVELHIDGEIEPILADHIVKGIEQANAEHAALVLITENTPGGLDSSMRKIIGAILASQVPVVTFVAPTGSRAASAGFFVLLSADVAAMAPGTATGAASPVFPVFGQPVKVPDTMERKVINDATAYLRSYTTKRGRNPQLAETAVTDAKAFSDKEALDAGLIDLEASSTDDLLAKLNGRTIKRFDGTSATLALPHPVLEQPPTTGRERFLMFIVQPNVALVLLVLGGLGLYTEFTHPGLFAPGVFGGIALVLALYAFQFLPVNIAGFAMIVLALALFVMEAKFPTHGVLGVGGALAMFLGAIFLIRSPWTGMGVDPAVALGVTIPFALIAIFLMRLVLRSRKWKLATGKEELVGEVGEITEPIGSAASTGMVFVHGELWRAAAPNRAPIPKGSRVKVKNVKGLTLEVEPIDSPHPATS